MRAMPSASSTLPRIACRAAGRQRRAIRGHVFGARQYVVEPRARETFHRLVFVEGGVLRQGRRLVEDDGDGQVGVHADQVVLVGRPVETGHANHFAAAGAADHDVVAALADEFVEATITQEHVVALDAVMGKNFVEVVAGGAVEGAGFDPVVTLVAEDAFGVLVTVDEVVAGAREDLRARVGAQEDEVLAVVAHDQVEARARHGPRHCPRRP